MKLALVGYGKMGRMIEQLAPEYGCEVVLRLDEFNNVNYEGITAANFSGVDVAIDFSLPATVAGNVERIAALRVPLVVGTTGWESERDRLRETVLAHDSALVWSANFSIGVNLFFRLAAEAGRLMEPLAEYGAWGYEIHHDSKKDAPSGTLIRIVDRMRRAGFTRAIDVSSNRAGKHPGTHEIGFDSAADTITLRHTARNREGFARGALVAAKWIEGKKGFREFSEALFG